MEINKKINGNTAEISVIGWLDTQTAPELAQELEQLEQAVTELVLNLAELEYISSAGLRLLVSTHKMMSERGTLTIRSVSPEVADVLKMTGLDSRLNIV